MHKSKWSISVISLVRLRPLSNHRVKDTFDCVSYAAFALRNWGTFSGNVIALDLCSLIATQVYQLAQTSLSLSILTYVCIVANMLPYSCIHCKTCDIKVPDQDINWVSSISSRP